MEGGRRWASVFFHCIIYNLILRLHQSFSDSSQLENRIQEVTWLNRDNCRIPSLISSKLLKRFPVRNPLSTPDGLSPSCPSRLTLTARTPAWGHFQPGWIWAASLSRWHAAKLKYYKTWLRTSKSWQEVMRSLRNGRASGSWLLRCSGSRGEAGTHVAVLIHTALLPEVDFYKSSGNFSLSAKPDRLAQNQKSFTVGRIIVWEPHSKTSYK